MVEAMLNKSHCVLLKVITMDHDVIDEFFKYTIPIFSCDNIFIQILSFRIFKYT